MPTHLATVGPDLNVNVNLTDIARVLPKDLDNRLADLLELADFAYAADGAVNRKELLSEMTADDVTEKLNMHLSRAARHFDDVAEAARRLSEMHVRHGREAMGAIADWISANPRRIAGGEVEPTSLVGMVLGREHLRPAWDRLAATLCEILDRGLPPLVQTKRPENEPRLPRNVRRPLQCCRGGSCA